MNWKYVELLNNKEDIEKVESTFGIKFPIHFKKIVLKYNGGYPQKNIFDTERSKERVFSNLLDFNLDNRNNVLDVFFRVQDILPYKTFPFGSDPAGNYLCFDFNSNDTEPSIIFWKHEGEIMEGKERYETEYISGSFEEFLSKLYSQDENFLN